LSPLPWKTPEYDSTFISLGFTETFEELFATASWRRRHIPVEQLRTTDDCGFSPFCDETSTTREKAFAKIRSRVEGTALVENILNGS
jgi:5-methyltetrahydropteroyltriglutamate--homocysteine methyltransferase